ncbi:type IV secretory system conjugative DNA transfer family protein, partial [Jeotgalibacillus sp. ET6]|uniref:type IV secretory system conjugative DNA transfer family protein n=1 Tax=Jeotgalibacillus sp. ET6 TaxID=3037260 RepID=UPI00241840E0
ENLSLSRNINLKLEKFFQHVLVIGSTGTGKSASVLIPQLLALDGNISVFVTDPKAELFRKTSKVLKEKGFTPILLKLDNPDVSIGYNLLEGCRDEDDVRKLSEGILGQGEWSDLSKELLNSFLLRQYEMGGSVTDAVKDMSECPQDIFELELEYFSEGEVTEKTRRAFNKFAKLAGSAATVSSIFATVQSKTTVFEFDKINEIQNKKHFDITKMRSNKVVLFVSYPEEDSTVYQPFLSSFYYQCFNLLKSHDSVNEEKGEMTGFPILFLLDEFANIGKIPSFDNLISTIRSKKMGVEIFLQNIEQITSVYGKETAATILSNASTKMTMFGNTEETNKFFSALAGSKEVQKISHSDSGKGKMSRSISTQEKSVISTDELRRLKGHQILIITSNLKPIVDDKNYYYMDNIDYFVHKQKLSDENKKIINKLIRLFLFWKK